MAYIVIDHSNLYIGLDKIIFGGVKFDEGYMATIDLDKPKGPKIWGDIKAKFPKSSRSFVLTYTFTRDCGTGKPISETLTVQGDAKIKD